jgi:Glycogen recognition site of AMP-activated protein kinase
MIVRTIPVDCLATALSERLLLHPGSHRPDSTRRRAAGLDIGWSPDTALPMAHLKNDTWTLTRTLPPGRYPYKFIMDGVWSYDADLPTIDDGDNINNAAEVIPPDDSDADRFARARILESGVRLTKGEAERLREFLGVRS